MRESARLGAAIAAFICSATCVSADPASPLCEKEMTRAAKRYDVPLGVLYSVGLAETGRKGSLSPYALNIAGHAEFADSAEDALRRLDRARTNGAKLIDVGCMQINHYYHGSKFADPRDMLEPRHNVEYAAKFLKELRLREGSWTMAVARYHAGPDNDPAQKRYVCRVIANMVASGFGAWTREAASFCGRPQGP